MFLGAGVCREGQSENVHLLPSSHWALFIDLCQLGLNLVAHPQHQVMFPLVLGEKT